MKKILIDNVILKGNRVTANIKINEEINHLYYEFPYNIKKNINPYDALLVAFMPVAMRLGQDIKINGCISKQLYNQMLEYQDIVYLWYPNDVKKVSIIAKTEEDKVTLEKKKNISCFTGGVDAFYTLLKNEKTIDDLLYVWGFDIPLTEENFYSKVKNHLSDVAKKFNKNIIFVKTNLGFEITNKYASWIELCHGAAIASVVLLMSDKYKLCYIPSSNDYSVLSPHGSHILINHLFSSSGVKFIYDGAESPRTDKVAYIANNKVVQNNLRVCYKSNDEYNCCQCEKCIRTMASLEAIDKLKKVKTFSKKLELNKLSEVELNSISQLNFAKRTMQVARNHNKNELANEIEKQINNYENKSLKDNILRNMDQLVKDFDFMKKTTEFANWHAKNNKKYILKQMGKKLFSK